MRNAVASRKARCDEVRARQMARPDAFGGRCSYKPDRRGLSDAKARAR
jgi:hypothetical protein